MALDDGRHPDAERLAEYADGTLGVEARAEIERHLADCPACRAVVMETMAFLENSPAASASAPAPKVVPFRSRRWVTGVAAGLAVAAALVLGVRVMRPAWLFGPRGDRPELQELIAAVANEPTRPVEGRLTGGFKYAPPPSTTRGAGDREVPADVKIATAKIEKLARDNASAQQRAALGAALLVSGDCDKAIGVLEASVKRDPPDASALNNLSAAYIQCAQQRRGSSDLLAKSVQAANESIARAPEAPEGYFNRALAFELMGKPEEALDAWRRYLRVDGGSSWSTEAQGWIAKRER